MELPAQALIAIATVIGALIGGVVSFVNLTLSKEQKTSEFRQAWIDGLREDLAQFLSAVRTVARAEEAFYIHGSALSITNFPPSAEQIQGQRQAAAETLYRIKLRLNADETEHKELLRLLQSALDKQLNVTKAQPSSEATITAVNTATDYARCILKAEWRRVKRGEVPFRLARNWLAPIIIVLCIGFVVFLAAGKFKV